MKDNNLSKEGFEEIKEQAIDYLKNNPDCYGCDLHHYIFNEDYFIIGCYQAEEWLKNNYGIFSAIEKIKEYEQDNFGEMTTDLSSSENVVNMLVYILGEELLSESETLNSNKCWDNHLTEEDCKNIIEELEEVE